MISPSAFAAANAAKAASISFSVLAFRTRSLTPLAAAASSAPLMDGAAVGLFGFTSRPIVLAPGKHALVPTGLTIALPPGYEAQVRPRSGLAAKHGVTVLNAPGTVDADYRGEIGVLLINHGDAPFSIRRGERIAQMVIASVVRGELVPAASLSATDRGGGGFGSTGR